MGGCYESSAVAVVPSKYGAVLRQHIILTNSVHFHRKLWRGFPSTYHTHTGIVVHPYWITNHLVMIPISVPVAPLVFPLSPFEVEDLFTFSPFGLGCRQCEKSVSLDERCIRDHAKKHEKAWDGQPSCGNPPCFGKVQI